MDTKVSLERVKIESQSTDSEDFALHQQPWMDSGNEKYIGHLSVPSSFYRNDLNGLGSTERLAMTGSEKLNEQAALRSAHARTYYRTSNSQIYAFKTENVILTCSGDQCFPVSTSDTIQTVSAFLQYAPHGDSPDNHVVVQAATGDVSAYQICSPTTSLQQGVAMASPPGPLHNTQQVCEEASRKRELRLMKNREAARECRRKKKEYVKCLENRVAVLENQNKTLIEELKALKDLYAAKECRRRKKEYVNYLQFHVSMLEQQNKKLMEELNCLKGFSAKKSS